MLNLSVVSNAVSKVEYIIYQTYEVKVTSKNDLATEFGSMVLAEVFVHFLQNLQIHHHIRFHHLLFIQLEIVVLSDYKYLCFLKGRFFKFVEIVLVYLRILFLLLYLKVLSLQSPLMSS